MSASSPAASSAAGAVGASSGAAAAPAASGPATLAAADAALAAGDFTALLRMAQQREMEEGGQLTKDSELWYCIELYAAALAKELLTSKFVWKRIPLELKKKSKDLALGWKLLVSLHQTNYVTFFSDSAAVQTQLSIPLLQRLNEALRREVQSSNLLAIRKGYSAIGLDQAGQLLGLKKDQVAAFLTQQGWTPTDTSKAFFAPTPLPQDKERELTTKQVEQLTAYVQALDD